MVLFLVFSLTNLSLMLTSPHKSHAAVPDREFREALKTFKHDADLVIEYQRQKNFWSKSKAIWVRQKYKSILELSVKGDDVSIYMLGAEDEPTVASAGTKISSLKFPTPITDSPLTTWGYLGGASVSSLILYDYLEDEDIELTQAIVDEIIREVKFRKLYITENSHNSDDVLILINDIAKEVAGRHKNYQQFY